MPCNILYTLFMKWWVYIVKVHVPINVFMNMLVKKKIYIYKCICKCLRVFLSINYIYAYVYCFTCVWLSVYSMYDIVDHHP